MLTQWLHRPVAQALHLVRFCSVEKDPLPCDMSSRGTANSFSHSAVIPCLIGGGINAYNLWAEHWEHWEHMPPLEERTEYPYQNIRVKNYPWGDGDKVSLGPCVVSHMQDQLLTPTPQTIL